MILKFFSHSVPLPSPFQGSLWDGLCKWDVFFFYIYSSFLFFVFQIHLLIFIFYMACASEIKIVMTIKMMMVIMTIRMMTINKKWVFQLHNVLVLFHSQTVLALIAALSAFPYSWWWLLLLWQSRWWWLWQSSSLILFTDGSGSDSRPSCVPLLQAHPGSCSTNQGKSQVSWLVCWLIGWSVGQLLVGCCPVCLLEVVWCSTTWPATEHRWLAWK